MYNYRVGINKGIYINVLIVVTYFIVAKTHTMLKQDGLLSVIQLIKRQRKIIQNISNIIKKQANLNVENVIFIQVIDFLMDPQKQKQEIVLIQFVYFLKANFKTCRSIPFVN